MIHQLVTLATFIQSWSGNIQVALMLRMLWTLASVSIGCAPATVHSLRSQSVGLTARTRGLLCSICPALLRSRSCGRLQRGSHRMASTATPPEAIVKDVTLRPGKSSKHNPLHESIFVSDDAPVYEVPMQVIHRPLQSFTNENKVCSDLSSLLSVGTGPTESPLGHLTSSLAFRSTLL